MFRMVLMDNRTNCGNKGKGKGGTASSTKWLHVLAYAPQRIIRQHIQRPSESVWKHKSFCSTLTGIRYKTIMAGTAGIQGSCRYDGLESWSRIN